MDQDLSIKGLFNSARSLSKQLETLPNPTASKYQETLHTAINQFEECRTLIDRLSLFSPNESFDDISSGDLQYLLTDYHLADLTMKDSVSDRKGVLRRAQKAYERYLHLLDSYRILSKEDQKLNERFLDNRDEFALIPGNDAAARRDTKVARFKQEKELKMKLEYLNRVPHALQGDDAAERELYLAEIELATHHTFHALDMIAQELKILALMPIPATPSPGLEEVNHPTLDNRDRNNNRCTAPYSERLDPPLQNGLTHKAGPILSSDGKPLKPFTLLSARQEAAAGVFRPDHSLPTMTIDEYIAEEKRRGGIIDNNANSSGGGKGVVVDEDDLAHADEETMKAREWDEFKEANPKGSGNTLNRG